jgi:XisH protein
MPNEDACQPEIVGALQHDGWIITGRQVYIESDDIYVYIDLEATKVDRTAFIEVKCFSGSYTTAFYAAVGQYLLYREVLDIEMPSATLYLAIPSQTASHIYDNFGTAYGNTLRNNRVKIIVIDLEKEVIVKWIA